MQIKQYINKASYKLISNVCPYKIEIALFVVQK